MTTHPNCDIAELRDTFCVNDAVSVVGPCHAHTPRRKNRGFSLIEIMVVIGLIAMVGAFGLLISFDDYRGYGFRNERDVVMAVLHKARSQSMSNMCFGDDCTDGKAHGVYFGTPGRYVIFQGTAYDAADPWNEVIEVKNASVVISGMQSVVFTPLSGMAVTLPSGTNTLTVTDERGRTSLFTIEPEGRVTWTN